LPLNGALYNQRGSVKKVSFKFALDATIATLFVTLGVIYILIVRVDKNIESINLTNSELSCKASSRGKYRGLFTLNGNEYFSSGTYRTCDEFLNLMKGKEIKGKHQKNKRLLVELRAGKSLYSENSVGMRILTGIFIGLVCFAFLRNPIHWIAKKVI
jgi:hypothetical protein